MKDFKIRTYGDRSLTEAILDKMQELGAVNTSGIPTTVAAHLYNKGNRVTYTSSVYDAFYCKDPLPEISINELFEMRELPPLPRVWGKRIVYDPQKDGFDLSLVHTVYTPTLRRVHDLMHQQPCVTDITLSLGGLAKREYLLSRTKVQQMLAYVDAVRANG